MLDLAVLTAIIEPNLPVYIAYSGGIDSHVLLSLCASARKLNHLSNPLTAIHINHGISPHADYWQAHCQQVCAELQIEFISSKVNLRSHSEASARKARLTKFHECIGELPHNLLFAHHALDQAETVLFRLVRGTSIDGIAGMRSVSQVFGLKILRPLLNVDKAAIIAYAQQHNLKYITDESNAQNKYARNYLRNIVIPQLVERWPTAVVKINNFAQHALDLKEILEANFALDITSESLSLKLLKSQTSAMQRYMLAQWLKHHQLNPSVKYLEIIIAQVINAQTSAQPQLKIANKYIVRSADNLYILDRLTKLVQYSCVWNTSENLKIDFLNYTLEATALPPAELLLKVGIYCAKAKKIFQEHKIPVWQRANCILLYHENKLIKIINTLNLELIYQRV